MSSAVMKLKPARLQWRKGMPFSLDYDDIYYAEGSALPESEHVFLQANRLQQRWQKPDSDYFTIGECGFGAGLNFLNTCSLWCQHKPATARLHYLACELHPLRAEDLERLLAQFPELADYSSQLQKAYPPLCSGIHQRRLNFSGHQVQLTLLFGDANRTLQRLYRKNGFRVDAWYLDGFSPRCNPQMWTEELCRTLAIFSRPGTSLSTYSAAGGVRKALDSAGFQSQRIKGFGKKRHMLSAEFQAVENLPTPPVTNACFIPPPAIQDERQAVVIGAGLAGCATAYALAEQGWQVCVLEREASIASMASGNKRGIVDCKLSAGHDASAEFYLHSYLYSISLYQNLAEKSALDLLQPGLLYLAADPGERDRRHKILASYGIEHLSQSLSAEHATALSGIKLEDTTQYFPDAISLNPVSLCKAYLQHPAITLQNNQEVIRLTHENASWHISDCKGLISRSKTVIIANSQDALHLQQSKHYPLLSNYGQLDEYPHSLESRKLAHMLSGRAYVIPTDESVLIGGLTLADQFEKMTLDQGAKQNLALLARVNENLADSLDINNRISSRAALRCSSPDYLPLVGPVENTALCLELFKGLSRNARQPLVEEAVYQPGLYINVAHGSNALSFTPYAAAYLSALITETPAPCSNRVADALHPLRFLIRDLKKQRLPA